MNGEILLWVLAYAVLGLFALSIAVSVVAAAIKSVHPRHTYSVTLDLDDGVQLKAIVDTSVAAAKVINTYAPTALKPGKIGEVER